MAETINLGSVTAYASAVEGGYTGTYAQFCTAEANFANVATNITAAMANKADLVEGKVPASQLPSYVDDVIEGYYDETSGKFYEESIHTTEITPESGKIYIDITDPTSSASYRWSGTAYINISNPVDVMTGATSSSAGASGLVPAPAIGDQDKFLRGDGTWAAGGGISHFCTIPTFSGNSFTYNGTAQGPTITWQQDESSYIEITNATNTDAGVYTLTISLKNTNTTVWSDFTTVPKTYEYTIEKAAGSATLSANSVTLDSDNLTATVTLSDSTGDMTISSSDTTIATVSPVSITAPSGTITISNVNETSGSATININVAASDNYLAATASVAVTASFVPTKSFTDASFDEMAEMLAAHYAGTINIADYWAVGQEHEITISAMSATGVGESHAEQTATVVLTNVGGKYLSDGVTECAFQWDLKNSLAEKGYMNSSNTNSGGWKNSARRTWCNDVFYNALPEKFRNCTKQFINQSGTGGGSSSGVEDTTDKIALRAEIEIFGSTTYSVSGEGSQVTYYETSANRIKKLGNSGSAYYWWERSPRSGGSTYFCCVGNSGSADGNGASYARGLAPCGCL